MKTLLEIQTARLSNISNFQISIGKNSRRFYFDRALEAYLAAMSLERSPLSSMLLEFSSARVLIARVLLVRYMDGSASSKRSETRWRRRRPADRRLAA